MSRRTAVVTALLVAVLVATAVAVAVQWPGGHRAAGPAHPAGGPTMVTTPVPGPSPCPTSAGCTVAGATGRPVAVMPWSWATELAFYQPPDPLTPAPPGTLVRIQHLAPGVRLPTGSVGWRILYHSVSVTGVDTVDSGVVIAPAGAAPAGGFPLVTYGHPTAGLAALCAPSRYATFEIPSLASFLAAGDAVVATDYEGLGTPGPHPYLVGDSEGRSMLDAARAARQVPGLDVSRRVVAYGYSQGGQGALFAGQLAPAYAPDLDLVGVVAESPAVAFTRLIGHITTAAALNGLYVTLALSWSEVYPGLPLTSLLSPAAIARDGVTTSGCEAQISEAYAHLAPGRVRGPGTDPASPRTSPVWRAELAANSPGGRPIAAPVLVASGAADQVIPPALTADYVARACTADHDRVVHDIVAGADHGTIVPAAAGPITAYVAARLAGRPAPAGCHQATVARG